MPGLLQLQEAAGAEEEEAHLLAVVPEAGQEAVLAVLHAAAAAPGAPAAALGADERQPAPRVDGRREQIMNRTIVKSPRNIESVD